MRLLFGFPGRVSWWGWKRVGRRMLGGTYFVLHPGVVGGHMVRAVGDEEDAWGEDCWGDFSGGEKVRRGCWYLDAR